MQLTLLLWWYIYGGVAEVLQKNSSTLDYNKFKHLLFYYFLMCKKKKKRSSYSKTNFCPSLRLMMYLSSRGRGTFTSSLPNKSQNNRDSLMNMSYMALFKGIPFKGSNGSLYWNNWQLANEYLYISLQNFTPDFPITYFSTWKHA